MSRLIAIRISLPGVAVSHLSSLPAKVDPQMTPLIDVVFQLLAFFLLTFHVAPVEHDFRLKLPRLSAPLERSPLAAAITLQLVADDAGRLVAWRMNGDLAEVKFTSLDVLRPRVWTAVDKLRDWSGEEPVVELLCDDRLRYEHVVAVIEKLALVRDAEYRLHPVVRRLRLLRAPH